MLECCRRPEHTPEPPAVARRQRPLGRRRGTPSLPASLAPTRKSGKVPTRTPVEAVDPRFRRPPQRWRQGRRRPPPPQERHLGAMLECCRRAGAAAGGAAAQSRPAAFFRGGTSLRSAEARVCRIGGARGRFVGGGAFGTRSGCVDVSVGPGTEDGACGGRAPARPGRSCGSAFSSPAARGACLAAFFRARSSRRVAVASLCESGEIRSREQRGTRRTRGRARAGRGRSTFRSVLASARARLFSPSAPNMPRRNHEDSRLAARWEKSRNCGLSARPPGSGSQASCSQFRIMYAVHWWDCTNHTTGIEMEVLWCGRRVIAFVMSQKAITQTTA